MSRDAAVVALAEAIHAIRPNIVNGAKVTAAQVLGVLEANGWTLAPAASETERGALEEVARELEARDNPLSRFSREAGDMREAARRAGLPREVSVADIENLAREYATLAPAASESPDTLPTTDELAQALTECAPARPGIYAEAEAILHELRKNRAALAATPPGPPDVSLVS